MFCYGVVFMLNILDIMVRNCNQYDLACNYIFVLGDGINSDLLSECISERN